jgi:hypothetical protein
LQLQRNMPVMNCTPACDRAHNPTRHKLRWSCPRRLADAPIAFIPHCH